MLRARARSEARVLDGHRRVRSEGLDQLLILSSEPRGAALLVR
jgi:hypothetical protein